MSKRSKTITVETSFVTVLTDGDTLSVRGEGNPLTHLLPLYLGNAVVEVQLQKKTSGQSLPLAG